MSGIFKSDLLFELRGMLVDKSAYDFRNRLAHGFASDGEYFEFGGAINIWWLFSHVPVCANFIPQQPP